MGEFAEAADELHSRGVKFAFGGTPPVAERAKKIGFFDAAFDGTESPDVIIAYLQGSKPGSLTREDFPNRTIDRI
nr:methionine synthase [candidate division Zixibacteria bacterium]NIW44832.1 methionine synthase [Gammaproteobacteria bacterium]NIR63947.1 methionine synthase [candidate division Zixibacteria bacterium]NIS45866.1 methionine synthase [candidate division Zixibacteria bacterium]NIU14000.1 methionine synthase [candidate division Zixibacteria bacterium]